MVGSIDPRCETVRGTHWPNKVAWLFGARVAETILASDPSRPHQTGRTYGCKRSDQTRKTLAARGASTYGSRRTPDVRRDDYDWLGARLALQNISALAKAAPTGQKNRWTRKNASGAPY